LDNNIYDTEYHKQLIFNYNSMLFKTAVQKDRYPFQFEGAAGCDIVWGAGLEPPQAQAEH